jgi:hypothetical protein
MAPQETQGVENMTGRSVFKIISVLTLAGIGIVGLAIIFVAGWFFFALVFPNRMNVTGRVTDRAGKPIMGAEVRAVPLPVYDAYSESGTMEAQGKEQISVTDEDGRFRFQRLIASGGVKEGMWLQEYDIHVDAEGYRFQIIRLQNSCDRHKNVINLSNVVLEKETSAFETRPENVPAVVLR